MTFKTSLISLAFCIPDRMTSSGTQGDLGEGGGTRERWEGQEKKAKERTPWERTLQTPVSKIKINPISKARAFV
jgi:hypothetical protein